MRSTEYILIIFISSVTLGCFTGPNDGLDNPYDPNSPDFVPLFENVTSNLSQSDKRIIVRWEDKSSFEDGFIIEKRYSRSGNFFPIDTTSANIFNDLDPLLSRDLQYRVSSFVLKNNKLDKRFTLNDESVFNFGEITELFAFAHSDSIFVRWFSDTLYDSEITLEYKEASSTNWTNIATINDTEKVFYLVGLDFSVSGSYDFRVTLYLENYKGELEAFDQKVFQYN